MRTFYYFLLLLFLLLPICAEAGPARYALVLADPPVANVYGSREAMAGAEAQAYRMRIRAGHEAIRKAVAARDLVVTGEADTVLNAVFVVAPNGSAAALAKIPGVASVVPLRQYKLDLNRAATLVDAGGAWTALGGMSSAGLGIKIAILDTGIDQTHAAFQDAALTTPSGYPICKGGDCAFTSNKVIVARSYVAMLAAGSSASNPAAGSRPDDISPRDHTGHGTAVASVAAGNTNTGLLTITGIAPHAFLGNYRIFGSPQVNDTTSGDVIIVALEDAIKDGMDIISLSLGATAFYGPLDSGATCGLPAGNACDILAASVETAAKAGTIIVVAAGNSGLTGTTPPGFGTIASPGSAPSAITVGATTNSHTIAGSVTVKGTQQSYAAYLSDGPSATLTAPLAYNGDLACGGLPVGSASGAILLIERGGCTFLVKLQNAKASGAVGVIFYMADGSTPIFPAGLAGTTIPAVMVSNADGNALQNYLSANPGTSVTMNPALTERLLTSYNQLAGFSSQGPVTGNNALKPELVATGTNMYMAAESYDPLGELYGANGYTIAAGTSFATPLVTGAAALVKQSHPGWTAAQVKSALVNNAVTAVTQNDSGNAVTAQSIGAGLLDAGAAVGASVTVSPATISFGAVPPLPASQQITLTNNGGATITLALADDKAHEASAVSMSFDQSSVTLAAGASQKVTVTISGSGLSGGSYSGAVTIAGTGVALRVPYFYLVPTGVPASLIPIYGDAYSGTAGDTWYLLFKLVDSNGLPVANQSVTYRGTTGAVVVGANLLTNGNGIGEAEISLSVTPGPYSVTASAGGLSYAFTGSGRAVPLITAIANAASANTGSPIAPGSYVAISGLFLSDVTGQASTLRLPMAISNVNVSFDVPSAGISVPGHLTYVSPGQINVQVPWELAGQTTAQVKVIIGNTYSSVFTASLADNAPAFFEGSAGVVSALDLSYNVIGPSNPALRGQTIQIYANGLGPVSNTPASGDPASTTTLSMTTTAPTVTIGGQYAPVVFSGLAPGLVGLYQMNVTIPGGLTPGNQPIVVSIGGVNSKASGIVVQ